MPPFIIYALPRSRTFWLSKFLTYGDWVCGHEQVRHLRSLDDVAAYFSQPYVGTVETAAAPWWRLVQKMQPDIRTVVVRRDPGEVVESLMRTGLFDRDKAISLMRRLDTKLDQIEARVPDVLSVRFDDLASEEACAAVFERCLGCKHDHSWWQFISQMNLQDDLRAMMRHFEAFRPQLDKLAAIAKHRMLADIARKVTQIDGVTIQQEPFDAFERDGQHLFAEHCTQVGETPQNWRAKNLPLMRILDQLGVMQITTARSNGRMFGYLMALISPSLEHEGVLTAVHTTFFAAQEFRGLGIRLQQASVEALRARGVKEIYLHAGIRGSGPRMPALYRRMGATDYGHLFMLDFKGETWASAQA